MALDKIDGWKKIIALVAALLVAHGNSKWGWMVDEKFIYSLWAYTLGQGLADMGKAKATAKK